MHINRLRLLGFKSFVEPTELVIEKGLTGVVGPNGCGKSNLLEALRWVMGETSHKSMRAAAMDDVIFSGTQTRPARNTAEVTIFIDNSGRQAPSEFNDHDTLEVTRRIEREAGSAFRINGREVRARDVRILFEDAATGARSPALVRQGQIGELVNAKPEQRRRILEDAAGIAGLHSRRHEAELRLRAAGGQPLPPQRHPGPAQLADRKPEATGAAGTALQGDLGGDPQARCRRAASAMGGGAGPGRRRGGQSRRGAGESRPRHRGRIQGDASGSRRGRTAPAAARPGGSQRRRPRPLQDRAGQPGARGAAHGRPAKGSRVPRRAAQPRHGARRDADRRGQGDAGAPDGRNSLARQHGAPGGGLRAEGARRPRSGGDRAQRCRDRPHRAHHRGSRGARAPAEPGNPDARAPRPGRQARAPAGRPRGADARDRRPRAGRLQAQGRKRARPAADGRDRQHRGRDARRRGSGAGDVRRSQDQEQHGGRDRPRRRPAQDRGRDARQAAHARRRQRPAADPRRHQGGGGLRDGAGRGAGRRSRRAGRAGGAHALAPERGSRAGSRPPGRRRAAGRPCRGATRADAPPAPDRRRRRLGRSALAASPQARAAPGLGRRPPVALGRLRRRRAGVDCRRFAAGRAQPAGRAGARGDRSCAARPRRRAPLPRRQRNA